MDTSNQQRLLYAIAILCLVGTAGAVYWSTAAIGTAEVSSPRPTTTDLPAAPSASVAEVTPGQSIARSLRAPLYDPPPSKPPPKKTVRQTPPPKPVKPKLKLTLVGTIIDANGSLAIIEDAQGKFDVKGEGDSLELTPAGVRIGQIDSDQITLQYQGAESTIRLEKKNAAKPSSNRRNNGRRGS